VPRLFVAVWPPAGVLDSIEALDRPEVAGLRWTRRDHWHVTLRFLGSVPDVQPVTAALEAVAPSVAAAEAVLGPAVERFGRWVLHVPVSGLDRVAAAVVAATTEIGRPPGDRPFAGHVTLARVSEKVSVDLRPLAGAPVEGRWPVTEVCLVRSDLSGPAPRYEVEAAFPLSGFVAPASGEGPPSAASEAP